MKKILSLIILLSTVIFLLAQVEAEVAIYDDAFEGKKTASGDIFSQDSLTAAHETLPLGTRVEILHVACGKRVTVTVTDRIENAPGLIWISKAAADSLNIRSLHPTRILYTVVDESAPAPVPAPQTSPKKANPIFDGLGPNMEERPADPQVPQVRGEIAPASSEPLYGLQVYAAGKRSDALELSRRLMDHIDYLSYVERARSRNQIVYRVIIGDFHSEEEARACYAQLYSDFPESFIVKIY
jgi:rare lipoprotein A